MKFWIPAEEEIQQACPPWRLAHPGELLLSGKIIEQRAFADIAPADKTDFGQITLGQLVCS